MGAGALNWANLTAPECWILDWEDWGLAPRGLDAAQLWLASLEIPALAQRVAREFHDDLNCRSGMVAARLTTRQLRRVERGPCASAGCAGGA